MNVQSVTAIANYYQQSSSSSAVSVAEALSAVKLNARTKFSIQDTAANIESNFANLAAMVNNVSAVSLTDTSKSFITISAKQLISAPGVALTNKMNLGGDNKVSLNVVDALAKDIATLKPASNSKIGQFSIRDSSTNITTSIDSFASFESKLGDIQITDTTKFVKLTSAQYFANEEVRTHFTGTFGLEINGASTAEALSMASDNDVSKVNIVDKAQTIADNLDALQEMGLKVNTIKSDDGTNLFKVSGSQLQKDGAVIGKLYKGYQLAVFNIDAATALTVKKNKKIVSLDIVDNAEGISKNLSLLNRLGTQVHSLQITDKKPLTLTSKDFFTNEAVLQKVVDLATPITNAPVDPVLDPLSANFNNKYKVDVIDSSVFDAKVLNGNSYIKSISIKDSSENISANLNDLKKNLLLQNVLVTGSKLNLNISFSQLTTDTALISTLKTQNANLKFNVRGVAATDAQTLLNNASNRIASLSISDTAKNIVSNISKLAGLGKSLTTIIQTDARVQDASGTPLKLTANEWMLNIGTLSKIVGGYGVSLTNVSASKAISLASDVQVKSFEITDTAASISANFDSLQNLGSKLTAIHQLDAEAIEITGLQYKSTANVLSKMSTYKLAVKSASASQIIALLQDKLHIKSVEVLDTVDNISNHLQTLQTAIQGTNETQIQVAITGALKAFELSYTDLETYDEALKVIQGNYKVNVSDVGAADAQDFATNSDFSKSGHLLSMSVKATSDELHDTQLLHSLNSLGNMVSSVKQSDESTITISQIDWQSNINVFDKIKGYLASLVDVTAASAKSTLENEHVLDIQVNDSSDQISQNFDTLVSLGPSLTAIEQSDVDTSKLQLSMSQWAKGVDTLGKFSSSYAVDLFSASAADAMSVAENDSVASVQIIDTPSEISKKFDALTNNNKISSISLTGAVAPIAISLDQLDAGTDLLDLIKGGYTLAVSDADASRASELLANSHLASVELSGDSSIIDDALYVINQFGPKLKSLSITGENTSLSMSMNEFQNYKKVLSIIPQKFQIEVNSTNANDAILNGLDKQFNLSFNVRDSAAQIASNLEGLAALSTKLASIKTIENLPILKMQPTQYLNAANQALLEKINPENSAPQYQLNLSGGDLGFAREILEDSDQSALVNSIDITDSANAISNGFDLLSNSKISGARLTAGINTLSLTENQYLDSVSLAKLKGAFSIEVRNASKNNAIALENDSRVSNFSIAASTSAVGASLPSLLNLTKLKQININQEDQTSMSLTMAEYDLIEDNLSKLVGQYGLVISGVNVSEIQALASKNEIAGIKVSDTSENVSDDWDVLVSLGEKLKSVVSTNSSTPLAITYDQFASSSSTLAKVPASYKFALLEVPPDKAANASVLASVMSLSVKGLANQIADYFETLVAANFKIDLIEVSDSNPIKLTQAQIDENETTLAKIFGSHEVLPII